MSWENTSNQHLNNNEPQSIPPQETSSTPPSCKLPGFGHFFSKTFSVYKNNFWTFLIISAIPSIVSFLFLNIFLKLITRPSLANISLIIPIYLIIIIISLWVSLSLLYAVKERDNKINIGVALKKGWSNLGSYIWVSFLVFVIVLGGFILFIIPGIIFMVWFALAMYVFVDENKKGMNALKRSKELISGYVTALWGRTLLFGLVISLVLFLFSFIIGIVSVFLPFLSYIFPLMSAIASNISIIFIFLVYENIKKAKDAGCKKSPREIKYILIALLLLLIPIGILASTVLVSLGGAREKAKDARIISDMAQLRTQAELTNNDYGSYTMVDCNMSADAITLCNDIGKQLGVSPVSNGWPKFTTPTDGLTYCAHTKLRNKYQWHQDYYCIERGKAGYSTTANIDCTAGGVTASCGNLR